ncbi:MAG: transglutaminase domain-containing protein [Eubacteriales bacterium]|nr:transglutaminase domain-containing protein [Eubacteriales bacterium]
MRKGKAIFGVLALSVCLAVQPGISAHQTIAAASTKVSKTFTGLKKVNGKYCYYQKGKKIKNKWKTINGKKYYFNYKGNACTGSVKIKGVRYIFNSKGQLQKPSKDTLVKVGSATYYVDAKGKVTKGWKVLKGKLYYVCSTGAVRKNMTWQGITFTSTGAAANNTATALKIKTMEILDSITSQDMTKAQKLQACWNYVTSKQFSYVSRWPNLNESGWQKSAALTMLNTKAGNCYSFACAFAALAAEIGYQPQVLCGRVSSVGGSRDNVGDGRTPHCWVKIDGRYYDPEAQFADWAPGIYGDSSYPVAGAIVQQTVDFIND